MYVSVFSLHSAYKSNGISSQGPQKGEAPCHLKRILFKLSVYAAYKPHQGNKATPSVVFLGTHAYAAGESFFGKG